MHEGEQGKHEEREVSKKYYSKQIVHLVAVSTQVLHSTLHNKQILFMESKYFPLMQLKQRVGFKTQVLHDGSHATQVEPYKKVPYEQEEEPFNNRGVEMSVGFFS